MKLKNSYKKLKRFSLNTLTLAISAAMFSTVGYATDFPLNNNGYDGFVKTDIINLDKQLH